eukprot:TRINITY_DN4951_c0_g1_i26.p2 TRINITY_DN4951_c0_g1~~TRINITY_DN4951_c0_g1_i26.p2  ORF type:complete len:167 (+),score=51.58 TRINITY_DN4951_c0_g1_i26:150-650(+)
MDLKDPFEDVVQGNVPQEREDIKAQPKKFEELVSAGPSEHKKEFDLGKKASGLFNKLTSKVGSLLDSRKEEEKEKSSPPKRAKDKMFIIDEETASLKPKEQTSPTKDRLKKGDVIDKNAALPLIPFQEDSMFSMFTKVNDLNKEIVYKCTAIYDAGGGHDPCASRD